MRLAVLVSGTGTILDAMVAAGLPIALVAADRPCPALDRAAGHGIAAELVERETFGPDFDRTDYTHRVVELLERHDIELVAMAGWGTIFGHPMYDAFGGRVLNTHPALLPAFPGWHAVHDALAYGVKVTGCTVHLATLEVDAGPILAQACVTVEDDDSVETLHERIKVAERELYVRTLRDILARGRVQ